MNQSDRRQLNRQQIEACLKSATRDLVPDVLERIDLSTPQEQEERAATPSFFIRQKVIATLIAACFCMIVLAGGTYSYQNGRVDSVIGIDVNPSVELSVNRHNKVLSAKALNKDAESIMQPMDLKGVDLNVAVNAVIGAMVTNGYLSDMDNAILVTVANDSVKKAKSLRSAVVSDIQSTLEERQLKAVVYDQQVIEEDHVKELAGQYGISYGKAYFLKELIAQNPSLTMNDMKKLSSMTMEEIAKVITERAYAVGGKTGVTEETTSDHKIASTAANEKSQEETYVSEEPVTEQQPLETESQTTAQSNSTQTQPPAITIPPSAEASSSEQEVVSKDKIKIDYVDFEDGSVMVYFKTKVKWKNPTVSVKDDDGNTYSAKVTDTDSDYCEISVTGLAQGQEYTFVLGGISPKIGKQTTVKGVFETPVIGNPVIEEPEESDETEKPQETSELNQTTRPGEETSQTEETESSSQKPASQEQTIKNETAS
ncbi:hypothetical protein [Lacrimispora sp. JR3]|uniref:anti-sigma-I factor RsgI family protein n=1 Tax=Lacrimispora sinapis TaxID=3111456 RepID=UPI0037491B24